MTIRRRPLILASSILLSAVLPAAPAVLAAPPISPLVGEIALTGAERQHALDTMRPNERAALRPVFEEPASDVLVTSYERRLVRIVTSADGKQRPEEIVKARQLPGSGLRVPNEAVAGSAKKEDLYISLTVTRTRSTKPYEWRVWTYAEWRDGLRGMNPTNSSADSMALAWAGAASLHSQAARGERYSHWPCADEELDEWPSDGTPNVGTAWSFHEFGRWAARCTGHWPTSGSGRTASSDAPTTWCIATTTRTVASTTASASAGRRESRSARRRNNGRWHCSARTRTSSGPDLGCSAWRMRR